MGTSKMTTIEHIIQYCEKQDFEKISTSYELQEYKKCLSETIFLHISISDTMLNVGLIILGTQKQTYKGKATCRIDTIHPDSWKYCLNKMIHNVTAAVFDKMTGLS